MSPDPAPRLTAIVIHWHDEVGLRRLVDCWPDDPTLELLIVDNGSQGDLPTGFPILGHGVNRGFAAGVNLGLRRARAPIVLILNSDLRPAPGAMEALLDGFQRWPDAAALAPRLVGPEGRRQTRWQIRSLPHPTTLLLQSMLIPAGEGPSTEPAGGDLIEQPAAAALAIRRETLVQLGGFDERYFPAWFEDVDLARRMRTAGMRIRYCPTAELEHDLGTSVQRLGYGPFLRIYYTNLRRYLDKHHGRSWSLASRLLLAPAALARLLWLPLRKPRRAATRREAAAGLIALASHTLTGRPRPEPIAMRTQRSTTKPETLP